MKKLLLLGQRGVIQVFPLLLILFGIIVGVALVTHPTFFRPKASGDVTSIRFVYDQSGNKEIDRTTASRVFIQLHYNPESQSFNFKLIPEAYAWGPEGSYVGPQGGKADGSAVTDKNEACVTFNPDTCTCTTNLGNQIYTLGNPSINLGTTAQYCGCAAKELPHTADGYSASKYPQCFQGPPNCNMMGDQTSCSSVTQWSGLFSDAFGTSPLNNTDQQRSACSCLSQCNIKTSDLPAGAAAIVNSACSDNSAAAPTTAPATESSAIKSPLPSGTYPTLYRLTQCDASTGCLIPPTAGNFPQIGASNTKGGDFSQDLVVPFDVTSAPGTKTVYALFEGGSVKPVVVSASISLTEAAPSSTPSLSPAQLTSSSSAVPQIAPSPTASVPPDVSPVRPSSVVVPSIPAPQVSVPQTFIEPAPAPSAQPNVVARIIDSILRIFQR